MPRGKKICPNCNTECGVRTGTCECGHIFSSSPKKENSGERKKTDEKKEEYISPETRELLEHAALNPYVEPEEMSADDHADRILSYGKDRAKNLVKAQKSQGGWSHINWKKVEAELTGA